MKYSQPMISRETRLLLTTIVVSLVALWVLARVRFQERPPTVDRVPAVLAQLRPQSNFDDLARLVADMRSTIDSSVFAVGENQTALRLHDTAVTLGRVDADVLLQFDRPTGLSLVRNTDGESPSPMPWVPRVLDYPRYFIAAEGIEGRLWLRPVFVGGMFATPNALWGGDLWQLADASSLSAGTFVFTMQGALAGLTVSVDDRVALVPATLLLQIVDQLARRERREPGNIGIFVQLLTPAIAAATGAERGVVVTSVETAGSAAKVIRPTDVIESVNRKSVSTLNDWRASVERLAAGDTVHLSVRRNGDVHDVEITASRQTPASPGDDAGESAARRSTVPGLRLRTLPSGGAQVLAVSAESSAGRAGLQRGDVITVAGPLERPTGSEVMNLLRALDDSHTVLIAYSRGGEHYVSALGK